MRDQPLSSTYNCGTKVYTDNGWCVFFQLQRLLDFIEDSTTQQPHTLAVYQQWFPWRRFTVPNDPANVPYV